MLEISQLRLPVDHSDAALADAVAACLPAARGLRFEIFKRAIDARKKSAVLLNYTIHAWVDNETETLAAQNRSLATVELCPERRYSAPFIATAAKVPAQRPVIVGTGPCGLFCGLLLARAGCRPILLERGKAAGPRAKDVTGFWRRGAAFLPESNVQFGEGGAGTFSDGKLYTQIKDREHRIPWLLKELVRAGAPSDVLIKARPHIGTDRLIKVVRTIREEIQALGGEVRFETRLDNLLLGPERQIRGVVLAGGEEIATDRVILAIGHSARDTFATLHALGVAMESKPLSIGVRIEHPQRLIDATQYGKFAGHPRLGTAPYKFVHHARNGRTAYSFCMCPGGLVVAAASEPGGVVTNGMSSFARAEANANAGFMVDVSPEDYSHAAMPTGTSPTKDSVLGKSGVISPLSGIAFQRAWEQKAFALGGGNFFAPAQRLEDFMANRPSKNIGEVKPSYEPGVIPADLRECLPAFVVETLRQAIPAIARQLRGFDLPDAILTGVETRSSSPLRILRHPDTFQSLTHPGLYPGGEGAGYAGGIISAAVDGMKIAEVVLRELA